MDDLEKIHIFKKNFFYGYWLVGAAKRSELKDAASSKIGIT